MTSAGATAYGYDNNGNQTSRGTDSFSWDAENRLTSASVGGTSTTFAYNGDSLRNSLTAGGVTTTFTWDVNDSIPRELDDGAAAASRRSAPAAPTTTFRTASAPPWR